jgi:hypothetical protein
MSTTAKAPARLLGVAITAAREFYRT